MRADANGETVDLTLADGSTVQAIEVEIEVRYEGGSYLARDVPYVVPVDWRHGTDEWKPNSVRLFAVVPEIGRSGESDV